MNTIANKIKQRRIEKGLSQQDLAEQSKLSLRTIQRIESAETQPREVTLKLLCSVLGIEKVTQVSEEKKYGVGKSVMDSLLYTAVNLLLMFAAGLFTIDSFATLYTRIAGLLLSFFIPYFIVSRTLNLEPFQRLVRYGSGYLLYVILLFVSQGIERGFFAGFGKGLFFCIVIRVSSFFYKSLNFSEISELSPCFNA